MIFSSLCGAFCHKRHFYSRKGDKKMRAGFLGQSICSLGFGIATLQAPRLVMDVPVEEPPAPSGEDADPEKRLPESSTASVTITPRLWA